MTEYCIHPGIFMPFDNLLALQTLRHGGVSPHPWASLNFGHNTGDSISNIDRNRTLLCSHIAIDPDAIATADQVHGTEVCHVTGGGHYSGYDAFITDTPGVFPAILTADCYPVLIYDPVHQAAGAIHAGWKGTASNITGKTVLAMQQAFGSRAAECKAWIGTGISREAYEVGPEVASCFDSRYIQHPENDRFTLDIAAVNRDQLLAKGVKSESIALSPFCTARDNRHFFSYRHELGCTGRMLSLIGIRKKNSLL